MKKVLLWIGGIALVLVLAFIVVVILLAANVFPASVTKTSVSQDSGYVGAFAPPMEGVPESASPARDGLSDDADFKTAGERIVIRSAWMAIVSKDVQKTVEALKTFTTLQNGFIVSVRTESDEGLPPTATVSFRIPADALDATVAFVRSQAVRVATESITGEDVTEEYVDLTAKLHNLSASETQLLSIMKDARKTEDVLSVRREIERVRGEIDALTGRKKYLDQAAKLSSVTVSIATDEASLPVVESGDEWRPFVVAKSAAASLLGMLKFLVNVVIWAIVFVPVWGTAILVVRFWRRRRQQMSP